MRSKQASIYFIQSSQSSVSRLIAEISIILFSQCEALHSILFLYYSILLCFTFHPIFISALRRCLCSFYTVYPLFIMTLLHSLNRFCWDTFIFRRISYISYSCDFCRVFARLFPYTFLSHLWIESHYQSMAYLVEKDCSTQRKHCIEELH